MREEWEQELADFLRYLSDIQGDLIAILIRKRECLASADAEGLTSLAPQERRIEEQLRECLGRRAELLKKAQEAGWSGDDLRTVAGNMGADQRLGKFITEATYKSRLAQIHNLVNWMLNQRALIHLSQLIEIIATRGQGRPTYNNEPRKSFQEAKGTLVDQQV